MFKETNAELKALQDQIDQLNAEAADKVRDQAWRTERSHEIAEEIFEGFMSENLVDQLTTTEYLPRNGRSTIRETRGLKAFHVARGGYIEESFLHSEVTEIERDQIGFHVVEHLDRLETNFAVTASDLIDLGKKRLDAEINRRVLATFQAAVPSSSPYYTAASGVTLTQINTAIAAVQDETAVGELPVIIGRAPMIRKIEDALTANNTYSLFLPETNESLLRSGVLGSYRGCTLVQLKNYLDEDGDSYFPGNELWFLGKDAGKTAFFGTPRIHDMVDFEDYWHYSYRADYGTIVTRPERTRRIVDSTVSA